MDPSAHMFIDVTVIVLKDKVLLLLEIVKCSMEYELCHLLCHMSDDFFERGQIWG
jgi:hypothetical protein